MAILHKVVTPHNDIRIEQEGSIRKLLFGYGVYSEQSGINISNLSENVFDYSLLALQTLSMHDNPENILVIGLGGGVIPRRMSEILPNSNIDVIEIDEEVVKIAKEYFFFKESEKLKVHIGDAFEVLNNIESKFDIIIIDAFTSNSMPFHITSREFNHLVLYHLKENGVSAINACNIHPSFNSQVKTLYGIFGNNIYYLNGPRNKLTTMLFSIKGSLKFNKNNMSEEMLPKKIEITQKIKDSKVIVLSCFV